MNKPIKDHTSTKILTVVTLLSGVISFIKPWEVSSEWVVAFVAWSLACWVYTEDMYKKDLIIYNLHGHKESNIVTDHIAEKQEDVDSVTTVDLSDDLSVYNTFMPPLTGKNPCRGLSGKLETTKQGDVCQCHVGEVYLNIDNTHSVKGNNLVRKDIIVAKRCFVHNSWRIFEEVEDSIEVTKEDFSIPRPNLLQLDENISSRLDVKFKEKGIE